MSWTRLQSIASTCGIESQKSHGGRQFRRFLQPLIVQSRSGSVSGAVSVVFAGMNGQDRAGSLQYRASGSLERPGVPMIFGKLWRALSAQFNKIANVFWTADP